jgi:uncharacterized protein YjbJ (UPF0337 family)
VAARHLQKKIPKSRRVQAKGARSKWNMNALEVKGNWNIAKGKLKQKFARWTEDDVQFVEGKEDELLGRIQKRTGRAGKKIRAESCRGCKR